MLLGGPLGLSLAPFLQKHASGVFKALKPLANAYANAAGYRGLGMKYDDLIMEEREDVQKAISRLPTRELYDRSFRLRVAIQQSILHKALPRDQWVKPEDDVRFLTPIVAEVMKEDQERADWDSVVVEKKR